MTRKQNQVNRSITENEMVQLFLNSNFLKSELIVEVPVYSRCVDLVSYSKSKNYITAIEFKTNKWKEAINQALDVSMPFDFLEICLLEPKTDKCKSEIIENCKKNGIGIYFINPITGKIKHVLKPVKIQNIWKIQKKEILKYLKVRLSDE